MYNDYLVLFLVNGLSAGLSWWLNKANECNMAVYSLLHEMLCNILKKIQHFLLVWLVVLSLELVENFIVLIMKNLDERRIDKITHQSSILVFAPP